MQVWTKTITSFLNLFLQSSCPLCQRPACEQLCQDCTKKLLKQHAPRTWKLSEYSVLGFSWGTYGGMLKRAIAVMKYENQPQIADILGKCLAQAWIAQQNSDRLASSITFHPQLVVVPIPLHPDKLKRRGYNQAALIAKSFCEITGLKLKQNGLERIKATAAQFGLSVSEREKNLTAAFGIGRDFYRLPAVPVLLVDDIYTTGATATAAVQTLHQHHIKVCGFLAVAATRKDG